MKNIGIQMKDIENNNIYPNPFPIGAVYISVDSRNPSLIFGGTWEQIKDCFLLGCGNVYRNGTTGGESSHKLTIEEMPSHNHTTVKRTAPQVDFRYGFDVMHFSGDLYDEQYTITQSTANTGGGQVHNNMPPYLAVFIWKRIA